MTGERATVCASPSAVSPTRAAPPARLRAWTVWGLAALSFGFAFFQRAAPSVMVAELMREFAVGAAVLGNLAAVYLYAYAGLQVPIGLLLDRFGARRALAAAAAIAALGSVLFALAENIGQAYAGRLLVGIGSAAGFVGALKVAAHWFPPRRYAFLTGLTMLVGMLGGIAGQAPLALLVDSAGWRATLLGAAVLTAVLAAATWLVVRDDPPAGVHRAPRPHERNGLAANLARVLGRRQNWLIAAYGGCMSGPMLAYAVLWGVPHLVQIYGLARPVAAVSASLVLIGWAVGAPLGGWLSDRIGRRKPPMVAAAALALIGWVTLLYGPAMPLPVVGTLLFAIGVVSGAMVICIALARELAPSEISGATIGFVNMANVGAGALLQPLVGLLLDLNWDGAAIDGARVYSGEAYAVAFIVLPCCAAGALLAAVRVPETRCRALGDTAG